MPEPHDLEINRSIRKVLVRHWIDLGRVFFRSINGTITIRGELERIAGVNESLTSSIVEIIFSELKRISGVKKVIADFSNWINKDGLWIQVNKEQTEKKESKGENKTFIIGTDE